MCVCVCFFTCFLELNVFLRFPRGLGLRVEGLVLRYGAPAN